jgi:hypothetical protein
LTRPLDPHDFIGSPAERLAREGFRSPSRAEHMDWCKRRALAYVERGELQEGFTSMMSDLQKHPETAGSQPLIALGVKLLLNGHLNTPAKMRDFIEGFN